MKTQNRYSLLPLVLIAPSVILLTVVFILPFFRVIYDGLFIEGRLSFKGFRTTFDFYLGDIFYTIFISAVALFFTLFFAILIGAFLRLHKSKWIEFLFKIPLFIPYVVVGHAMRTFLAPHGTMNSFLSVLGIINLDNPPSLAYSSSGIIIALVWKNIAFALLLIMAPFQVIGDSYLQAAQNAGAGFFRLIKDVLVPMSRSSILVSAIITFTSMMGSFSIPIMMGNGDGPKMLMIDLYYRITYQNDIATANALGMISFLLSFGAAWYYVRKVVTHE